MKNKKIVFITGGISVILLIIIFCVYTILIKPKIIFETFIKGVSSELETALMEILPSKIDLNTQDISYEGNFTFDTDYDLEELNILKNFQYDFQYNISTSKQLMNLNVGIKENGSSILTGKGFIQNDTLYLSFKELLEETINCGKIDTEEIEPIDFILDKELLKEIISESEEILRKTINRKKIRTEGVTKDYNGSNLVAKEYIYLLDKENQENTIKILKEEMLNNSIILENIAKMLGKEKEEIKSFIEEMFSNYTYESDYEIVITTKSLSNTIVRFEVRSESENKLTITDYNNKEVFIMDKLEIEAKKENEKHLINYKISDYSGQIIYTLKKENEDKLIYDITLKTENEEKEINVKLNLIVDYNYNLEKEKVINEKILEELTEEDYYTITNNFGSQIKGTSLESLLEDYLWLFSDKL